MTTKQKQKTKVKIKRYPVHYLAFVLVALLILEGVLFGMTKSADWQQAVAVLDVSSGLAETIQNTAEVFQPSIDMIANINEFYKLAATEMAKLLDFSSAPTGEEVVYIYDGVTDFYQQASTQMAKLLDVSDYVQIPLVAGISITNSK